MIKIRRSYYRLYIYHGDPINGKTFLHWNGAWFWSKADATVVTGHSHDDVIKWKHFPRYWPFVRGIHRSPVNSPCKGQWRGALMFSLMCTQINGWVNNGEVGDLRRHLAHYDVTVMFQSADFRMAWWWLQMYQCQMHAIIKSIRWVVARKT